MDRFIEITTVVLILAYIVAAIWVITQRKTIAGSLGASAGFLCGGFAVAFAAETIATILCWIIVIGGVALLLGFFGD